MSCGEDPVAEKTKRNTLSITLGQAFEEYMASQGVPSDHALIPDHKLRAFYEAVQALANPTARDYYLVLLLTGLRRNEAARLLWSDIDLEGRWLDVRTEIAKNGYAYRLPLG